MSTIQEKQLAQSRPAGTSAVSLYSPAASTTWVGKALYICNTTGTAANYSVFHDEDGTTYDESTALYFTVSLAANTTVVITGLLAGMTSTGNIAVQTGTGNALTFTLYGAEIT